MESIFTLYESEVKALWGAGLSKTFAIDLTNNPRPGVITADTLRPLFEALNSDGWKKQVGSNWVWRDAVPKHVTESKEVVLEREITMLDTQIWTCQISTSSGVQPNGLNRRRAIDLVRFNGNDRYAFIELKADSDNPLYAAFEILGYSLAYLQAKEQKWNGEGCHDVFTAKEIELTILGPTSWNKYKTRGGEERSFKFDWLAEDIAKALNVFAQGGPGFSMAFRQYEDAPARVASGSIDSLAAGWW